MCSYSCAKINQRHENTVIDWLKIYSMTFYQQLRICGEHKLTICMSSNPTRLPTTSKSGNNAFTHTSQYKSLGVLVAVLDSLFTSELHNTQKANRTDPNMYKENDSRKLCQSTTVNFFMTQNPYVQ